jgi:hypothetical protein
MCPKKNFPKQQDSSWGFSQTFQKDAKESSSLRMTGGWEGKNLLKSH